MILSYSTSQDLYSVPPEQTLLTHWEVFKQPHRRKKMTSTRKARNVLRCSVDYLTKLEKKNFFPRYYYFTN